MTVPRVTRCCDGHFRRVVYGLGPYIADYPEQALLACVVQNWCPKSVFLSLPTTNMLNIPFNLDVLPHLTISTERLEDLVLTFTQTHS
jgi:hypothetical protein